MPGIIENQACFPIISFRDALKPIYLSPHIHKCGVGYKMDVLLRNTKSLMAVFSEHVPIILGAIHFSD